MRKDYLQSWLVDASFSFCIAFGTNRRIQVWRGCANAPTVTGDVLAELVCLLFAEIYDIS
jgi:hypothetical protein